MRVRSLVGGVFSGGLFLVAAACGDDSSGTATAITDDGGIIEAGTAQDSAAIGDAGVDATRPADFTLKSTRLSPNAGVIYGMTEDRQIIYGTSDDGQTATLAAIGFDDGKKMTIAEGLDLSTSVTFSGGAVAYWTDEVQGIGTLNVWTKATGLKAALSTTSVALLFDATKDGSHIAYSDGATLLSTDVVLADTATAVAGAPGLLGANRMNLAVTDTGAIPTLHLGETTLFAAFCPGEADNAVECQLWAAPIATKTAFRVDNVSGGGTIVTAILPSPDDKKVYVISSAASQASRLVLVGTSAGTSSSVELEDNSAFVTAFSTDSATVTYRSLLGLRGAAASATPNVHNLASATKEILGFAPDAKHVLVRTKPRNMDGETNVTVVDTTTPDRTPVTILDTATAQYQRIDGADDVVYVETTGKDTTAVSSQPIGGGPAVKLVADVAALSVSRTLGGVVAGLFPIDDKQSGFTFMSLAYFEAATGRWSGVIADSVEQQQGYVLDRDMLVYVNDGGLFKVTLPTTGNARSISSAKSLARSESKSFVKRAIWFAPPLASLATSAIR